MLWTILRLPARGAFAFTSPQLLFKNLCANQIPASTFLSKLQGGFWRHTHMHKCIPIQNRILKSNYDGDKEEKKKKNFVAFTLIWAQSTLEWEYTYIYVIAFINSSRILLEWFPGYRHPKCKNSYPPLSNIYIVAIQHFSLCIS